MAAPTMSALVASVYVDGGDGIEHMGCLHCKGVVTFLAPGDLLTVAMNEVRKHAAVCANWPEHRRRSKPAAIVPGQLSIQLPDNE